jgi:hypothetical protein
MYLGHRYSRNLALVMAGCGISELVLLAALSWHWPFTLRHR